MWHALTHGVSPRLADCELSFAPRRPINLALAALQHDEYCAALARLGARVERLTGNEALADACFVEDAAVVVDELAVVCSMGVASRRGETALVERALARHRPLARIELPAMIEGGDVLRVRRTLFVGLSRRTNEQGAAALARHVVPLGYRVVPVVTHGSLHLKTACTALDDETLLVNRRWVDTSALEGYRLIDVPPDEPWSANVLRIGAAVCVAADCPRAAEAVGGIVARVVPIDISELRKAEAGLTCSSIVFKSAS